MSSTIGIVLTLPVRILLVDPTPRGDPMVEPNIGGTPNRLFRVERESAKAIPLERGNVGAERWCAADQREQQYQRAGKAFHRVLRGAVVSAAALTWTRSLADRG